jgi:uncharacterized protein YutE (UPF0331/DUF86 family)
VKYDLDKVTRLLSELRSSHALLNELSGMELHVFRSDPHLVASAKYNLIVAIESVIDTCNHLISKNSLKMPEDYADTFRIMADNNLISTDFSKTLIEMTRFRNRLVHLYWTVDIEILHTILKSNLEDFTTFRKMIKKIFGF